jgi:class 3 adenylate cyclase
MALATTVYGIMRYRLFRLEQHEKELELQVKERTQELETEKHKSETLLLNILPAQTAEELKQFGSAKARRFEETTVLFSDFKGFSLMAGEMEPEALVAEIDLCFRAFDEIMEVYDLEKIKTVGDAYLCAGGIAGNHDPAGTAVRVVKAALEIQAFLTGIALERKEIGAHHFEARIGIHSGPVIAGIVGIKKFAYDIWGDTVNIAERLQSNGEVGKVNISRPTYDLVKDHFECTYRGVINAKHGQQVEMFFVEGLKHI